MIRTNKVLLLLSMGILGILNVSDAAITQWRADGQQDPAAGANAEFSVTLPEDITDSATVIDLTATPGTGFTISSYAISEQPNIGQFEVDDGLVSLASGQSLDRQQDPQITIKVTATDSNNEVGTATVSITVTNPNNNDPVFSKPATSSETITVTDGKATGEVVYTLTATDTDADNIITYGIDTGNDDGDFSIDASSGEISVVNDLSRARTSSYTLEVTAADSGTPERTATATLIITVGDSGNSASAAAASLGLVVITMVVNLFQ